MLQTRKQINPDPVPLLKLPQVVPGLHCQSDLRRRRAEGCGQTHRHLRRYRRISIQYTGQGNTSDTQMICGSRNAHLSQIFPDDLAGMWRVVHTHGKFLSVIVAAVMKFLTHSIYLGFARMLGFESLVNGVDSSVEMESWGVFGRTASGHAHTSAKEMASVRVAVGISVARYPRRDPHERYYRIRLLSWMNGVKANVGPRMENTRLLEPSGLKLP